jgi:hypothetical protein
MFDADFWGEPIAVYTDADAQDDGVLIDTSDLRILFNGKIINRLTIGASRAIGMNANQPETAKTDLQSIAANSDYDGSGADAWGIYQPDARHGNEKFWLVPNEVDGYTLLLPEEY